MMQEPVYVCKMYKKQDRDNLFCQVYYRRIENFLGAIADNSLFYEYLPKDLIATLGKPQVYSGSNTGPMADDFEFRYENEVIVYIGQILFEEEKKY
ncbi:hypothetical protein [Ruminococcus sp. 2227st1_E6_2227SCRN_220401]|uniref:hypothetical protein n=1 Tax=unclassified Ruminococcus TaxID=2608920 RepID=UPI00319E27C7